MSALRSKRSSWNPVLFLALSLILLATQAGCSGITSLMGGEPVTLRFVFIEGIADYTSLADVYKRNHPNVTIELVPVRISNNPASSLLSRMEGADAVRIPVEAVSNELTAAFLPVDSLVSTDRNFPQDDIFPGVLEGLRFGGKQVGLPAGLNPYVIYYNPPKFRIAGLEPPSPAWTLEDFVLAANSIHDISMQGDPRFAYGFCSQPQSPDAAIWAYLFGGGIVDNPYQPTFPTLDRPENIEALSWYASLKNDFGLMPQVNSGGEIYRLRGAMACGFWMDWMDRALYTQQTDDSTAMLPLPAYRSPFSVANIDGYFLLSQSEHPNETYQWLRFLMEQEAAAGYLIPPLKSQVQSAEYRARVSPWQLAIAESMPAQTVVLGLEMYQDQRFGLVVELFMRATVQVMAGDVDAATALLTVQQQAESSFR